MASEALTSEVTERICSHMNDKHKDAVKAFASHYSGVQNPNQARLICLTPMFMEIEVSNKTIQISFDHTLQDSEDAHRTLVAMLKKLTNDS